VPILYCIFATVKRAAVSCRDMLRFYIAVIHPVMEYAAPVWHTGLNAESAESLESVQKSTIRIIFGGKPNCFTNSTYLSFCESLAISSLQSRRETLSVNFFQLHKLNDMIDGFRRISMSAMVDSLSSRV